MQKDTTDSNDEINVESDIDISQQLTDMINELNNDLESGSAYGGVRRTTELTEEERHYLVAIERGDAATVRGLLENPKGNNINANCTDPLGRNALHIAIENEHIELLELLLTFPFIELGDSLLHAISEEHLEAVEMILNAQGERGQKKKLSGLFGMAPSSSFTPDITPIILAAHRDNYEIIKLLLDRNDQIPKPHSLNCSCQDCYRASKEDSLCHSRSRINAYRALASPSLIALSSKDPILTAFELSWELKRLGQLENEFVSEYEELAKKCQDFAVSLLDQTRSSEELAIILNHESGQLNTTNIMRMSIVKDANREPMKLSRIKLAINYQQKRFVAHPHCQQLLSSLWYEGLPGFRRKSLMNQLNMVSGIASTFPVLSIFYLFSPKSKIGSTIRKPFVKFLCHSASYFVFLGLLMLAAVRIEYVIKGDMNGRMNDRGPAPSVVECMIVVYVMGFIWLEIKQLWNVGLKDYTSDMWNILDFTTNSLYVATITLRTVAYFRAQSDKQYASVNRKLWDSYDPILISECLFAIANVLSTLKLCFILIINPQLGPLQISLGRILADIVKFMVLFILNLIAFAFGLNQLYWFYAFERTKNCADSSFQVTGQDADKYTYCTTRGKNFSNFFEIAQSLYWSIYALIDLSNFNLEYKHEFTEVVGKTMFGVYSCIAVVVLINMLIAMMNSSYEVIVQSADTEWKFARTKLWLSYFEEGGTLPVPFNIIPSPKSVYYIFRWIKIQIFSCAEAHKKSQWKSIRTIVKKVNQKESRYQNVMQDLIQRYLMHRQKTEDDKGVTEDDLNEIKGDISAFRYELLEILRTNGMNTPNYSQKKSGKLRRRNSKRGLSRITRNVNVDKTIPEENGVSPSVNRETETGRLSRGRGIPSRFDSSVSINSSEYSFDSDSGMGSKPDLARNGSVKDKKVSKRPFKSVVSNPELQLNVRKLDESVVIEDTFNGQTGHIKKVSFNWRQDSRETLEEEKGPTTYVYDGNMSPPVIHEEKTHEIIPKKIVDKEPEDSNDNDKRSDMV